jgi:hypothetical protein
LGSATTSASGEEATAEGSGAEGASKFGSGKPPALIFETPGKKYTGGIKENHSEEVLSFGEGNSSEGAPTLIAIEPEPKGKGKEVPVLAKALKDADSSSSELEFTSKDKEKEVAFQQLTGYAGGTSDRLIATTGCVTFDIRLTNIPQELAMRPITMQGTTYNKDGDRLSEFVCSPFSGSTAVERFFACAVTVLNVSEVAFMPTIAGAMQRIFVQEQSVVSLANARFVNVLTLTVDQNSM